MINDGWQLEPEPNTLHGDDWLVFSLGGSDFALPRRRVDGDVVAPQPAPLPGGPGHLRGVAMVFGAAVPVLSLAEWLSSRGQPLQDVAERRLLVFESAGERFGILVDRIGDVIRSPQLGAAELDAGAPTAAVEVGERTVHVLNLGALCSVAPA